MAFGSPGPMVRAINILLVVGGLLILVLVDSWLRWFGIPLLLWGLMAGFMMGSWSFLIPGSKPVGRREDDVPPRL